MVSFTAGLVLGGIVGGSLGLVIATLVTGSSRASQRDRALGSYRAGLIAGRDRR